MKRENKNDTAQRNADGRIMNGGTVVAATPILPEEARFQVLLIEDDPHIARLVETNLNKAKLGCRIAATGQAGLSALQHNDVDLVLLDLGLPDMSGFEVCSKIRQNSDVRNNNVPIIMATARGGADDQMHGLRVGADDYVTKPFDPKLLVARVVAQLRRANRYNEVAETSTSGAEKNATTQNVPAGWTKCGDCNYIGPKSRFEMLNDQFRVAHACPNCGQLMRLG